MRTKHSKFNSEDSKYAYVVLRRGSRPKTESDHATAIDNSTATAEDDFSKIAYTWPRLIQPPLKKHGHVVMDVCAKEGKPTKKML